MKLCGIICSNRYVIMSDIWSKDYDDNTIICTQSVVQTARDD